MLDVGVTARSYFWTILQSMCKQFIPDVWVGLEIMQSCLAGLPEGIFSFLPFGIFIDILLVEYGHLVFRWPFWCIFLVLVCCTNKNLATRQQSHFSIEIGVV
jgi:hypothetical protein